MRLADNLYRIRRKQHLSQEQAAERCELSPRYIQMIEAGEANATIEVLSKLAEGLGIDVADLIAPLRKRY